jgi:hypothetical protein
VICIWYANIFSAMGCRHFWDEIVGGGETLYGAGGRRHSEELRIEVKDDQRKLGQWVKCAIGPNWWLNHRKKYGYEYEMCRKDRRRNISGTKRKKEIKTWNDFLAIEKWKIDSKGF